MFVSLIAAVIASPAAVYPALPVGERDPKCPDRPSVFHATGSPATARRLDREPPASVYLSVFRKVDGCATPVVLRQVTGR